MSTRLTLRPRLPFVCLSVCLFFGEIASVSNAGTPALIELTAGKTAYQGRLAARDKHVCWLMDRDGQLNMLRLAQVRGFRQVAPQFRSFSSAEIRDQLSQEFGRKFEVVGTQHYLVCAAQGRARKFAEIFEDVYRTFHVHFSVRGFQVRAPEFPLVAIVFPTHREFADYSRRDGVTAARGLMGYYMRTSNRVALFDSGTDRLSAIMPAAHPSLELTPQRWNANDWLTRDAGRSRSLFANGIAVGKQHESGYGTGFVGRHSVVGSIQGNLRDTMIHEATHQVAFNTGLHPRIGETPQWVVEGLATVFEAPGIRDSSSNQRPAARVNRERFLWFQEYSRGRRPANSLAEFVSQDAMFRSATLDAYSQAWALTFYLIETRPREYSRYLRTVTARNPLEPYSSSARLADFKKVFDSRIELLEADFLRFFGDLTVK